MNWMGVWVALGVVTALLLIGQTILIGRMRRTIEEQKAMLDWVDAREKFLAPLAHYAGGIHYGGAPHHSVMQIDGIPTTVEVPVPDADPKALPAVLSEGQNWVVRGDTVYEQRPSVIPSRGGMEQVHLLMEMEYERRKLIQPLREAWVKLSEWEHKNPPPKEGT